MFNRKLNNIRMTVPTLYYIVFLTTMYFIKNIKRKSIVRLNYEKILLLLRRDTG